MKPSNTQKLPHIDIFNNTHAYAIVQYLNIIVYIVTDIILQFIKLPHSEQVLPEQERSSTKSCVSFIHVVIIAWQSPTCYAADIESMMAYVRKSGNIMLLVVTMFRES